MVVSEDILIIIIIIIIIIITIISMAPQQAKTEPRTPH